MKPFVALAIVLASSAAAAQPGAAPVAQPAAPVAQPAVPVAQPAACSVTIARAPDDVRAIVEAWVKAEPTCTVKLEVRVVPTDGGYYLLARDEYGRVRERVVPDAQSAGVLVASWMAADTHEGQTPYDVRKPEPAPAQAPPPATLGSEAQAPGLAPVIASSTTAPRRDPRYFSMGGMFAMSGAGGGGVRTEWDMRRAGRWTFGMLASASTSEIQDYDPYWYTETYLKTFDFKVLGYVSLEARHGRVALRSSLGAGLVYTSAGLSGTNSYQAAEGVFPAGEATLSAICDIGTNWALSIGPIASLYAQKYETDQMTTERNLDLMMYVAARYRL